MELDLDQIGVLEGTDKSSSVSYGWDYLRHYQYWFAAWRDAPINIIEIGVDNGQSLQIWKQFFKKAKIVGIDINSACSRFADERVAIEIGSQEDPAFLHEVCKRYKPTIVIDDGSHQAHHIIYTLEQLFPLLMEGGAYIIEDLDLHFGDDASHWASVAEYNAPQYLLELANACLTRKNRDGLWGARRSLVETVESVQFINSASILRKKARLQRPSNVTLAKSYNHERGLGPSGLVRYAKYMANNGHDPGRLIDDLLGREEVDVDFYKTLAELQRDRGDIVGSLETLARGAKKLPKSPEMLWRYGHWLIEDGQSADGLQCLGQALATCRDPKITEGIVSMILRVSPKESRLAAGILREAVEASPVEGCRQILAKAVGEISRI